MKCLKKKLYDHQITKITELINQNFKHKKLMNLIKKINIINNILKLSQMNYNILSLQYLDLD